MILPVYIYGQPVLRKEAEDITPDYPNLKELIDNMFETMDRAEGCGLAAPQIGLPIRVVVIDLDVMSDDYPEYKGYRRAFINPHIIETNDEVDTMEEGCLSLPGIHEPVKRPTKLAYHQHLTAYTFQAQVHFSVFILKDPQTQGLFRQIAAFFLVVLRANAQQDQKTFTDATYRFSVDGHRSGFHPCQNCSHS